MCEMRSTIINKDQGLVGEHAGPIRRVIRSAGNLCLWHRL
jgi:hypothetical protein